MSDMEFTDHHNVHLNIDEDVYLSIYQNSETTLTTVVPVYYATEIPIGTPLECYEGEVLNEMILCCLTKDYSIWENQLVFEFDEEVSNDNEVSNVVVLGEHR